MSLCWDIDCTYPNFGSRLGILALMDFRLPRHCYRCLYPLPMPLAGITP